MKTTLIILILLISIGCFAQSKVETIANFSLKAADAGQTCWNLQNTPRWREHTLPTQSCAGVVAMLASSAIGAYLADRWLIRHGHPRWAHFQLVSAGSSGIGIGMTFTHNPY